jgi:hypothetical protein
MTTIQDIRDAHNGTLPAYAWPGGYQMFYLDNQNNVLCPDCANADGYDSEPIAADINYEDAWLFCDNCSEQIPAAYAD